MHQAQLRNHPCGRGRRGWCSRASSSCIPAGLAKFGIASAGWVPLGATVASRVPGGLKGLCLLGKSCPTHLFTYGDDEGTVVYSVGRDRSESAAKKRLASARQVDTALFSAAALHSTGRRSSRVSPRVLGCGGMAGISQPRRHLHVHHRNPVPESGGVHARWW